MLQGVIWALPEEEEEEEERDIWKSCMRRRNREKKLRLMSIPSQTKTNELAVHGFTETWSKASPNRVILERMSVHQEANKSGPINLEAASMNLYSLVPTSASSFLTHHFNVATSKATLFCHPFQYSLV
ncbi:hypothetical protein OIU78_014240 [Salix suchowensis]|nr:hypothetical protein OIU78_014240 [Salix suchowensis]